MQCNTLGLPFLLFSTLSSPFPLSCSFLSAFLCSFPSPFPSPISPSGLWERSGIGRSPISPSADSEIPGALCVQELSEAVWPVERERGEREGVSDQPQLYSTLHFSTLHISTQCREIYVVTVNETVWPDLCSGLRSDRTCPFLRS
jgi:hypothetical protein